MNNNLRIAITIFLLILPNILLILIGADSVVASPLKKVGFFLFSTALMVSPLLFLRPKTYSLVSLFLTPLVIFEIYNVYQFKGPSSEEVIASSFLTNQRELLEFLEGNLNYVLLFFIFITIQLLVIIKTKRKYRLSANYKKTILLFSTFILLGLYARDIALVYKIDKTLELKSIIRNTNYFYKAKLNKVFPIDIILKTKRVLYGLKQNEKYLDNIKDYQFNAVRNENIPNDEVYILVIGESARRKNFGLDNYNRKTTPSLDTIINLLRYTKVKSSANLTEVSVPHILTKITPINNKNKYVEPTILKAYNEVGFKTYWLSNQSYSASSMLYFYANQADEYKNEAVSLDIESLDEKLLPLLDNILKDKSCSKKFIIIHIIGSHFRYNYRYSKKYELFKPVLEKGLSIENSTNFENKREIINSYDNSIVYSDYILSEIINKLRNNKSTSFLYYLSDHGENLFDGNENKFGHGFTSPSKYELDIPLFIWLSNEYKEINSIQFKELKNNINKNLSSTNTFYTLLDMSNITIKKQELKMSFANMKFDTLQKRFYLTPERKVKRID